MHVVGIVVLCGIVLYSMVSYCMVCCGVVWYCIVCCGMVCVMVLYII